MKYFDWDEDKNNILKDTRNISFEEIVLSLATNKLLEVDPAGKKGCCL